MSAEFKIFYSWQSDSLPKYNRNFIEDCIKKAIQRLKRSDFYDERLQPKLDKDTRGLSGSPLIGKSIFEKINNSDVIIADLTPVLETEEKWLPNPNVLIEFGYALKALGDARLIYTMNLSGFSAHKQDKLLPFDLRDRRKPLFYELGPENEDNKPKIKEGLVDFFYNAIGAVYESTEINECLNETVEIKPQDVSKEPINLWGIEGDDYSLITISINFSFFTENAQFNMRFNDDDGYNYRTHDMSWTDGMPRKELLLGFNSTNTQNYRLIVNIYPLSGNERVIKWHYKDDVIPPKGKPNSGGGEWTNTADEIKSIQLFSNTTDAIASGKITYIGKLEN